MRDRTVCVPRRWSVAVHVLDGGEQLHEHVVATLAACGGFFIVHSSDHDAALADIAIVVEGKLTQRAVARVARLTDAAFPGAVVVVSHIDDPGAVVDAFDAGAHAWHRVPLAAATFGAQLGSLARRLVGAADAEVAVLLHPETSCITLEGRRIHLQPRGFELFAWLVVRREHWFTEQELLHEVWGLRYFGVTSAVRVQVTKTRAALGPEFAWLLRGSTDGRGYSVTLRRDSTAALRLRPHPRYGVRKRPS